MNNKNKILVGCLSLLLVLSVGYALFSETITINGTATAKGDFALTTTCQTGLSNDGITYIETMYDNVTRDFLQGGYGDDSCIVTGNTVDINVSLHMPGAARYFTVTTTNTGTIDAVIPISISGATRYKQTVNIYNTSDDSLYLTSKQGDSDFYDKTRGFGKFMDYGDGSVIIAKNASGIIYNYDDLKTSGMTMKDTSTGVSYLRIKPNESVIFLILAWWDEKYEDSSKYSVATFSNEFPFTQVTSDMVETSDVTIRY